ncbi:OmpA family protein [Galbibacter pacificus]|uniref:OmpA family protein n=1 Tax=Galbibacter pacificus TaxID=2996052 RepID=A0ABT6FWB2_9FLAO|nr:OmpA family protein [Galbibacter pacificus]MDG3584009.1 OmpA family protein [Galbibacter pacificus]MDG3587554.1 OmpA family protein [Galbibacter pacificus]
MKKFLILIILVHVNLFGQKNTWKADQLYADYHFEEAAELYKKSIANTNSMEDAIIEKLADCYFNVCDYQNAYKWYDELYHLNHKKMKESTFIKYVQSAKASRDYEKANKLINDFYADDYNRIEMVTTQKRYLDNIKESDSLYKIDNLDINTSKSDFAPVYYGDYLIFSSARDTSISKEKIYMWNKQPYLDIYIAERNKANGELNNPEKFGSNATSGFHDATLCFSRDGRFVYFTQNYTKKNRLKANKDGISNFEILRGYVKGDQITNVESLSFNSTDYSCGHPAISVDGRYLYFASDMPGGYGASDIYVAEIFEDGKTNKPVNLGATINTAGREMFPFATDSVLYFSSDAHYGLGGLDIFASKIESKTAYEIPLNMGPALNSNMDDFSLIYNPEDRTGYFASNRSLGKGDDDIYFFKKKEPMQYQTFSGYVYDKTTQEPIANASIVVNDILNDTLYTQIESDEDGYYEVKLPFKKEHELIFSKSRYTSETLYAKTTDEPGKKLEDNDVYLTSLESLTVKEGNMTKIDVDPIFFEYDKADITPKAELALEKVLYVMNEFPSINIMIESHTDSRGSDDYNHKLSNARAENTKRYLIANGIDANRIEGARGFGESKLLNKCSNGVSCTEAEHAINRRSNFIIIEDQKEQLTGF